MIKYVIFDMDGTLLDTERLYKKSWVDISEKWGLEGGEQLYKNIAGRSIDSIRDVFQNKYGKDLDFESFFTQRMDRYVELAKDNLQLKEGCFELLDFLNQQKIPFALATSTPMRITGGNLEKSGLCKYFKEVVTSEMVERGKPAPDIFIEAGRRINANNSETIVVEDSFNGIRGGFDAKMKAVMVIDEQQPNAEIRKLLFAECESLFDVIDVIKKENNL